MVTYHVLIMILLTGLWSHGASADEKLSPLAWFHEVMDKQGLKGEYVHHILILSSFKDGHGEPIEMDKNALAKDGFIDLVEQKEIEFPFLLNKRGEEKSTYAIDKKNIEDYSSAIFHITYADTVIYAPKNEERWTFYRPSADGEAKKAFAVKGPKDPGAGEFRDWLVDKLGYSGFLLDHKGSYILGAVYKPVAKGGNALLASHSESQLRIKKSEAQGTTLLKMVDCAERICIFEILIDKQEKWSQGAKIIF